MGADAEDRLAPRAVPGDERADRVLLDLEADLRELAREVVERVAVDGRVRVAADRLARQRVVGAGEGLDVPPDPLGAPFPVHPGDSRKHGRAMSSGLRRRRVSARRSGARRGSIERGEYARRAAVASRRSSGSRRRRTEASSVASTISRPPATGRRGRPSAGAAAARAGGAPACAVPARASGGRGRRPGRGCPGRGGAVGSAGGELAQPQDADPRPGGHGRPADAGGVQRLRRARVPDARARPRLPGAEGPHRARPLPGRVGGDALVHRGARGGRVQVGLDPRGQREVRAAGGVLDPGLHASRDRLPARDLRRLATTR